jgi:hypothetical protein
MADRRIGRVTPFYRGNQAVLAVDLPCLLARGRVGVARWCRRLAPRRAVVHSWTTAELFAVIGWPEVLDAVLADDATIAHWSRTIAPRWR